MKELVYRRTDTGYQIDRCPPELPKAMQAAGSGYAMAGMPGGVDTATHYYRQFRLSNGALVVGASYRDPFGDRRSGMADLLFAMDRDEALRVLASYPLGSRYFCQKKQLYGQSGSTEQTWSALEVSVNDFAGPRSGNLEMGLKLLAGVFGDKALLEAMFSALLDVASNNPRMIVLFGPREDDEKMAEHGRSVIEALLACLPPTAAIHIGYISPAENDDANALFGIRYSRRRDISPAVRGYAYVFDLEKKEYRAPTQAKVDGSGYAARLAALVFQGDAAAAAQIVSLRTMLDSPTLFDVADVPGSVGVFYRIAERPSDLTRQEMAALLSWRHDAVDQAERGTHALDDQPMWRVVEHWALTSAIADLLERRGQWRSEDPIYSQARADELFGDGQRLHRMGRPEARSWPVVYGRYLDGVKPGEPAGKELVKQFHDLVAQAQNPAFSREFLYWDQLSEWVLKHWSGALYGDRLVAETLDRHADRMPALAERFARAEADVYTQKKALRDEGLSSPYAVQVFRLLVRQWPDSAAEAMRRALRPRDPFDDASALSLYLRYREQANGNEKMQSAFAAICGDALNAHLAKADVKALLEMRQMRGPFADAVERLGVRDDPRGAIDKRLREAAGREGIYPFYAEDPANARKLAEALGNGWPDRLKALERANAVNVARLSPAELERLLKEGVFTADDRELDGRLRAMLEGKIRAAFNGAPMSEPMLTALALQSARDGVIYPEKALRAADRLGIPEKKALAFCRKLADPDAVRGVGYLARVFLADGAPPAPYPGQRTASRSAGNAPREWFAGIPMAAAGVALPLFAVGFALCAMGLLRKIGL